MKVPGGRTLSWFVDWGLYFAWYGGWALSLIVLSYVVAGAFGYAGVGSIALRVGVDLPASAYSIQPPWEGDAAVVLHDAEASIDAIGFSPWIHMFSGLVALPFLAAGLVAVYQLRRIFRTLKRGGPFLAENARRIRTIAWVVLLIEIGRVAVQLLLIGPFLARFETEGIGLWADASPSLLNLFWAAVLFVIADVFRRGAILQEEAALTV